ncbi:MAG: 2-hydroxyacyl-CoA dehydratase [Deltaproteobacteria bacterium]|nr:2-hydroxyacyl-CoA dehydratase [Deltaproteobacteria bacterium]
MEDKKEKKTSGKTLQTAREAGYFGKKMLKNAIEAAKEGRPTAWSMVTWWEGELIARAMGLEVVFPENYGAFCASVRQAERFLEISDSEGFPSTLCGYARNCFGYAKTLKDNRFVPPVDAPGGGLAKPAVLIGSGAGCDARYKWFQALGRFLDDTPLWTLELPQTGTFEYFLPGNKERNIQFITHQLREFVAFLESLLGKKMDWDYYGQVLDQTIKILNLAREVDELRKAIPSPMVAQDFWAVMMAHLYMPHDPEAYEFYQRVYAEVKNRVDHGIPAVPNEKYRVMFSELPPWHSLGFFDRLAEELGIVVAIESWSYHAAGLPEKERHGVTDPLELNARITYHKWMEYNEFARKYDISSSFMMGPALDWAKKYKVDGFLAHPLRSCRPATYSLLDARNLLLEEIKVPGVIVEGDIVDLRVFNEEEAMDKMGTFTETMDHYREVRKQEGFDW